MSTKQCLFLPSRPAGAPRCTDEASNPYGFCKRHSQTVQAKKAKEEMELSKTPAPQEGTHRSTIRKKTIRQNNWGRYEDPDTHVVFDPMTKCAYGVQESTGAISPLKDEHIEVCKQNGWDYNLPHDSDDEEVEIDETDESLHDSDFDEMENEGEYEVEEDELEEEENFDIEDDEEELEEEDEW